MSKPNLVLALLILAAFSCRDVVADDVYCGIYAIYGAASVVNNTTDEFERLIDKKYVSTRFGSKISDLMDAGSELGVIVSPLQGLGIASLRGAESPLILHVAGGEQLIEYDHWVLFLGIKNGKSHIFDSINASRHVPVSEVLARWDGVALAVSRDQDSVPNYSYKETVFVVNQLLRACIIVIVVNLVVRLAFKPESFFQIKPKLELRWSNNELMVGAATLVFSCLVHACYLEIFDSQSFLRNPASILRVLAASKNGEFPLVEYDELVALTESSTNEYLIIDARPEYLFVQGAISGAINVPIDGKHQQMIEQLKDIDRKRPVVLYCQSRGCAFDEKLAVRLASIGFLNIRLYREGWNEWRQKSMLNPTPTHQIKDR